MSNNPERDSFITLLRTRILINIKYSIKQQYLSQQSQLVVWLDIQSVARITFANIAIIFSCSKKIPFKKKPSYESCMKNQRAVYSRMYTSMPTKTKLLRKSWNNSEIKWMSVSNTGKRSMKPTFGHVTWNQKQPGKDLKLVWRDFFRGATTFWNPFSHNSKYVAHDSKYVATWIQKYKIFTFVLVYVTKSLNVISWLWLYFSRDCDCDCNRLWLYFNRLWLYFNRI